MCSDGILESNAEYENKEIWIKNLLEEIETDNVQKTFIAITVISSFAMPTPLSIDCASKIFAIF